LVVKSQSLNMAMEGHNDDETIRVVSEERAALGKVWPADLLKIMCAEAMIREPVITVTETESSGPSSEYVQSKIHTVCLTCHDKQLTVNFPATIGKQTCKHYAQHFLLKAFYTEYELPEITEPHAKYETVYVPRAQSQADVISHRNGHLQGMNRHIETLKRQTELSPKEIELRLYFVETRKSLLSQAGSIVKLPPFEAFITGLKRNKPHLFWTDAEKEERKQSNWKNSNLQLYRACGEFSLKADPKMEKKLTPEGKHIAIGSMTVFKKSSDDGKSLVELFRLEHSTERDEPDFEELMEKAQAGEIKLAYLDRFDHGKKWKKEICEMAVKQLVELGVMEDPDSAFKVQEQREREKVTRKFENEAMQVRNREAKIARLAAKKSETEARLATQKAAKVARLEAKALASEARRTKEKEAATERKRLKQEAIQKRSEERKVEAAAQKEAKNLAKQEAAQKRLEERQLEAAVLKAQKMGTDDRRKEDRFKVKRKSPARRESRISGTDIRDNRGRSVYDDNLRRASHAHRRSDRRSPSDGARRRRSRSPLREPHSGYAKRY